MSLFTSKGPYGYTRGHRLLEIGGITVFLGALAFLSVRIALAVKGTTDGLMIALCLLAGLLTSDLISGMVHWAGDTLGATDTPVIGPHFIKPFREHHVDPLAITRHDFVETNGNNSIASLPVLGAITPVMPAEPGLGFYLCTVVVFTSWFLFGTNQFHKWAHQARPPRVARTLQRWGLILSPTHHDIHHATPHDKYYCITVGWLNPILSKLRVWRAVEWMIGKLRPDWLHIAERSAPVPNQLLGAPVSATVPLPPARPVG